MHDLKSHPLNQASVMLLRKSGVPLAEILHGQPPMLPVLQLALLEVPEGREDGPESLAVDEASQNPEATLERLAASVDARELVELPPEEASRLLLNLLLPQAVSV